MAANSETHLTGAVDSGISHSLPAHLTSTLFMNTRVKRRSTRLMSCARLLVLTPSGKMTARASFTAKRFLSVVDAGSFSLDAGSSSAAIISSSSLSFISMSSSITGSSLISPTSSLDWYKVITFLTSVKRSERLGSPEAKVSRPMRVEKPLTHLTNNLCE